MIAIAKTDNSLALITCYVTKRIQCRPIIIIINNGVIDSLNNWLIQTTHNLLTLLANNFVCGPICSEFKIKIK